jgi:hypothetical protein
MNMPFLPATITDNTWLFAITLHMTWNSTFVTDDLFFWCEYLTIGWSSSYSNPGFETQSWPSSVGSSEPTYNHSPR